MALLCHGCGHEYYENCGRYGCPNCEGETGMTPAQRAKEMGLKSLTEVKSFTGVSLQTLTNWHRNKPELFDVVLIGCLTKKNAQL